jgi:hypothetical protein
MPATQQGTFMALAVVRASPKRHCQIRLTGGAM